ncbi:hypothetical protein GCM10023116_10360 [Kistimonas scapharcae]|uniref:Uncharacterized protein n=1 Tax=Kistimonas scapharcae TaxID=1036133 RepID=A0ABP8UXV7_9GAMM
MTVAFALWVFSDDRASSIREKIPAAREEAVSALKAIDKREVSTEQGSIVENAEVPIPDDQQMGSGNKSFDFDAKAIHSFSHSVTHGDNRAPSVAEYQPRVLPSANELSDPERYQRYEARQEEQLKLAFVIAAEDKIKTMETAIERAKAEGMDKEQLDEGIRKLEGIRAMKQQLEQEMDIVEAGNNPSP